MNTLDAVVTAAAIAAIVLGFMSGLLRSLAATFGYLAATGSRLPPEVEDAIDRLKRERGL